MHTNMSGKFFIHSLQQVCYKTSQTLQQQLFSFMALATFLPVKRVTLSFRAETTAENRTTHLEDLWPSGSRISTAYWCPNRRSAKVRLNLFTVACSLGISTQPRQIVLPFPFISLWRHPWTCGLGRFANVLATKCSMSVNFLKGVKNLCSLFWRLATSKTVNAYLEALRPCPPPRVSCGKKSKSAWWTLFGVSTSNLSREMCFGAGISTYQRACCISHFFALFSECFAAVARFLMAAMPFQYPQGL